MSFLESLEECLVGRLTFPLSNYLFNRRGILSNYRRLLKTQSASAGELERIQLERLKTVLQYAGQWVPYYESLFARVGFNPQGITSISDLAHLPPLTRKEVVEHRLELVDRRCRKAAEAADNAGRAPGEPILFAPFRSGRLVRNTSSGSTGAPTVFYEDGSITAANWANELRLRSWFGISLGAREARMARVSADYIRRSRAVEVRKRLWNQLALPGVSLTEADYALSARELSRFRPKVLWGFTSALTGLAAYLRERGGRDCPVHRPGLIITWAAPLHEHEESLLREVFQCPVTNVYGAREVGHIAARCPAGSLHVNQETVLVETESANGPAHGASVGELLVTTLTPTPMPFIRYRMGDLGALASSTCSCGRTLQVLNEFVGRTGEVFVTRDGRMISPNFWCRTFMDPGLGSAVERFQVVYRPEDTIVIRIVRGPAYTQATEEHLQAVVLRNTQGSARVAFEYPESIAPMVSGKYQMVVNETNA